MLTTTNYKFKKPELIDSPPDITVTNPNWDITDAKLKEAFNSIEDKVNKADFTLSNGKTGFYTNPNGIKRMWAEVVSECNVWKRIDIVFPSSFTTRAFSLGASICNNNTSEEGKIANYVANINVVLVGITANRYTLIIQPIPGTTVPEDTFVIKAWVEGV